MCFAWRDRHRGMLLVFVQLKCLLFFEAATLVMLVVFGFVNGRHRPGRLQVLNSKALRIADHRRTGNIPHVILHVIIVAQ